MAGRGRPGSPFERGWVGGVCGCAVAVVDGGKSVQQAPGRAHSTQCGAPLSFLSTRRTRHPTLQMTVRDALNSALDEEMDRDSSVFVLGEEVSLERR